MNRRKFVQGMFIGAASLSGLNAPVQDQAYVAGSLNGDDWDLKTHWLVHGNRLFHAALVQGPGFSFHYGGQAASLAVRKDWKISTQTIAGFMEMTFEHTSGLMAIRRMKTYPEFDAVEYTVTFKNKGRSTLRALGPISALHLEFGKEALDGVEITSSGGGLAGSTFPPRAYRIHKNWIGPMTPLGGAITLTTKGGRSSNKDLPFYFVQNNHYGEGLFVALGWSGQWSSTISGDFGKNILRLVGGIPDLHISLRPGEEIRGPRILIGCYTGSLSSGSNRLRRLIRTHCTPLLQGKRFDPIVTYDSWWNIGTDFNQNLLEELAKAAADVGQEYFLLDAGWYAGSNGPEGFSGGVGNWERVDRKKFPSGLKSFADNVRSKGLKFGLWFEPERVARGTLLANQHPDWVLWLPPGAKQVPYLTDPRFGLLDYSRLEVQEWVRNMLDTYIRKFDIRYIRHDFNLDPLHYWRGNDSEDRQGITQIRHIEGFYRVIDWVREHHPATVLEGCAGGGRRIDLETASRFHTFWISDQTADPHLVRFHLEGMNYFLPGNYGYVCYTLPMPLQKDFQPTDFGFQCFFGGAFGTGGRLDQWPARMKEQALRHVKVYKTLRKFLVEDYYLLAPETGGLQSWKAWQFHKPDTGDGFVQVFRIDAADHLRRFVLHALDPHVMYEFSEPYSRRIFEMSGARLTSEGLEFHLPKMSSKILTYVRKQG